MTNDNFDDLPWEQILEVSETGIFEQVFKKIPQFRFEFAADEANYNVLVKSALKSLRKKNPEATTAQAETLANLMKSFAQRALKR